MYQLTDIVGVVQNIFELNHRYFVGSCWLYVFTYTLYPQETVYPISIYYIVYIHNYIRYTYYIRYRYRFKKHHNQIYNLIKYDILSIFQL